MNHAYLRLWVELRPAEGTRRQGPWHEPRWHGLTPTVLRRALGNVLVKGFCPYGAPRCQPQGKSSRTPVTQFCQLAKVCPYGVLYAHSRSRRPLFAFYTPAFNKRSAAMRGVGFELTLYGPAVELHGSVLKSIAHACRGGLGKARLRWDVTGVTLLRHGGAQEPLCGADLQDLPTALPPEHLDLTTESSGAELSQVEVIFKSPTRLMREGRLIKDAEAVPCEVLVARILDRFEGLYGSHDHLALRPSARRDLEDQARNAELLVDETHWSEMRDYSARNHATLQVGGKVGRVVYGGVGLRLVGFLRAGEVLHVGKSPGFGCGRLSVSRLMGS